MTIALMMIFLFKEKGAGIIEKVGSKVKDMETADDETVTGLATSSFFNSMMLRSSNCDETL